MYEPAVVTSAREKAYEYVEDCLRAGWTWDDVIRALKRAWVDVHRERANNAEKDVCREIKP